MRAALIPISEQGQVPKELNIRGRFSFTSNIAPECNQLHYSSALYMDKVYGLTERYEKHNAGREDDIYLARRQRLPEIFLPAPRAIRTNATTSGRVFREGRSIAARNGAFYANAMGAFTGNGTYLRKPDEIATHISTIPIAPIRVSSAKNFLSSLHNPGLHHTNMMYSY